MNLKSKRFGINYYGWLIIFILIAGSVVYAGSYYYPRAMCDINDDFMDSSDRPTIPKSQ